MAATVIVLLITGLLVIAILVAPLLIRQRRQRIYRRPLPPDRLANLLQIVPFYSQLTPEQQRQLQGHTQVFLVEKQFIGCSGLQVTPEMRFTIAAIASLLLLSKQGNYFPKLRSILVYPGAYWVTSTTTNGSVVEEVRVARLGESWSKDQVVLAWDQVQYDMRHWADGRNVVLHEFAHQLDQADGTAEGVPILALPVDYEAWGQVMTDEYQQLRRVVKRGGHTVIDGYGATNPAEFFAVATETFFEKPRQLQQRHPLLYDQLRHYYRLHPLLWA